MKLIGPLMWEHRLIEQIVPLIVHQLGRIETRNKLDIVFIERAVDFFRTYADRTHHGKEEDILFKALAKKKLSPEHKRIMNELIEEHMFARKKVGMLLEAKNSYENGDDDALNTITRCMTGLSELYPKHIEKEDKHFFFPAMEYFTRQEQDSMLEEFQEFDRKMIHEKYQNYIEQIGGKVKRW